MQENDESKLEEEYLIQEMLREQEEAAERKNKRFQALSRHVAKIRDTAKKERAASGIEKIWDEDQDYYNGVDEFNYSGASYTKPRGLSGGLQENVGSHKSHGNQCTAFFNITQQFVDSAAARMGDILLPAGDWNWGLKKSPVPEGVTNIQNDPAAGEGVDQITQPTQNKSDQDERQRKEERRIKDWLTASRYHAENRKVIESAALLGTGVLKGPMPVKRKTKVVIDGELVVKEEIVPSSKEIDLYNCFPDMNCGENIQEGEYFIERDHASYSQLQELMGMSGSGYFDDAIRHVLEEGPGKKYESSDAEKLDSDLFELWYYTGNIDVNDLDLIGEDDKESEDSEDSASKKGKLFRSVVLVLVNDTIIKGHINPLENGEFPYDFMCWKRQRNSPFGVGVARQGRVAQKMLLSAGRSLIDNMGISSVPMVAMKRSGISPADGEWEIAKGKVWWVTDEMIKSIDEAIQFKVIPSLQKELMEIITLAGKMFEDATGVNFLLQGQQGSAPDTVGGMQLLHQNASSLLRRVARVYDENVTEPHIHRYHDWHLVHGDDDEKGDLEIEAIGSSALVEREIQAMQAQQILEMSANPAFGLSPKKAVSEVLKAWRFQPSRFEMDEDEKQALMQQQPPPDPRIQVAEIKSQTDLQIADIKSQEAIQKIQLDTDRDAVFQQGVADRTSIQYQMKMEELALKRDLAMLEHANKHQLSLDEIKAKLASDAMKINLQRELSMNPTKPAEQVLTPPSEPAGRADEGRAFQQ